MKKVTSNNNRNCKLSNANKRAIFRQTISFALMIALLCCLNFSVLAAEPDVSTSRPIAMVPNTGVMPTSVYGYAAYYTDASIDYFTVNAPGTSASTGHATIKSWDFNSNTEIYVTIVRPDGSTAKADVKLTGNTEVTVSFSRSLPGNYVIDYTIIGTDQGWLGTWIF